MSDSTQRPPGAHRTRIVAFLFSVLALIVALTACSTSRNADSTAPSAVPTVSQTVCDRIAAGPKADADVLALVVDRTRSGLARALPTVVLALLRSAQVKGWSLSVVSVNGAHANPIIAPTIALDPRPDVESAEADAERTAELGCAVSAINSPTLSPTSTGSDQLAALNAAARQRPREIAVVSDGVPTAGAVDISKIGYDADAAAVAASLSASRQLPALRGVDVVWASLGDTVHPLPQPARLGLQSLWTSILHAARAKTVRFDLRVNPTDARTQGAAVATATTIADPPPTPPVPAAPKHHDGVTCVSLATGILFAPDSAVLGNTAPLRAVATALRSHPSWAARVVGHTADYGPRAGQRVLSAQRASAVASAIARLELPARSTVTPVGVGSAQPAQREWHGTTHDLAAAAANRRVTVSYGNSAGLAAQTCR